MKNPLERDTRRDSLNLEKENMDLDEFKERLNRELINNSGKKMSARKKSIYLALEWFLHIYDNFCNRSKVSNVYEMEVRIIIYEKQYTNTGSNTIVISDEVKKVIY